MVASHRLYVLQELHKDLMKKSQLRRPERFVSLVFILFAIISPQTLECCLLLFKPRADMKDNNFELPFLWFMKSIHSKDFVKTIFDYQINLDLKSHTAIYSGAALKTDGLFHLAGGWRELSNVFDVYHPYWLNRKLFFVNRAGSAAFVSVCQIHSVAGYIDPQHCRAKNDDHNSSLPSTLYHIFSSVVNKIREQDVKILNQQRAIDNLLVAVRSLNVTVSSCHGMDCGGVSTALAVRGISCFVLFVSSSH